MHNTEWKEETVVYVRRRVEADRRPNWSASETPLCRVTVKVAGGIGDGRDEIEVDFANKDISYGRGGTQEELMFGMSPEMDVIVLLLRESLQGKPLLPPPTTSFEFQLV
mgnify:FL=1